MRTRYILLNIGLVLAFNAQAAPPQAFEPFAGGWQGTLEYNDYQGSGRVKIPVKLSVKPTDATSAIWDFQYDDFGKPVPSYETHSWNGTVYRVTTKGQSQIQEYKSQDFAKLIQSGTGKAVLIGTELEIGASVEVRRTITLEKKKLVTLKETRLRGGKFEFRNQSVYTRQP